MLNFGGCEHSQTNCFKTIVKCHEAENQTHLYSGSLDLLATASSGI